MLTSRRNGPEISRSRVLAEQRSLIERSWTSFRLGQAFSSFWDCLRRKTPAASRRSASTQKVIDLLGQGVMGLAYSGKGASGILSVIGSGGTIAELDLAGHYTTSSFAFTPDGHGGTDILHA